MAFGCCRPLGALIPGSWCAILGAIRIGCRSHSSAQRNNALCPDGSPVPERTARTVARALNRHAGKEESSTSCDSQIPATGNRDLQEMVRRLVSECVKSKNTVHNQRTRLGHKPSCDERVTDGSCWTTACGRWWYGLSRCVRNDELLPGYRACRSCLGNHKCEESASVEAEESASESSDSCSSGQ